MNATSSNPASADPDLAQEGGALAPFDTLLNEAPLGVYLVDADLRIRAANPVARAALSAGVDPVGRDLAALMRDMWPGDYADEVVGRFRHTLVAGEPYVEPERARRRLDRADDAYYQWQINRIPLPEGGHGVVCYLQDVTVRVEGRLALERLTAEREQLLVAERAARADAEIANRAKDQFLATLSHELRTPLSNIVSWSKVAQRKAGAADEQLKRALGIIVDSAMAQSQLMSDMLDMSRIVSGRVMLDAQPLDIVELVSVTAAAIRPTAEAKGIELAVAQAHDSVLISGDVTRLRQVLRNLLSNAIKFTGNGGKVGVSTRVAGAGVVIAVQDTGEGIARDVQPYIFDRCRPADGTVSRRHGGLGLGLAIVKQLVELHGGSVEVASAGPGRGSTFSVTLPVLPHQLRSPLDMRDEPIDSDASAACALAGCRVMVVEDQRESLEHLTQVLEEHGASTLSLPSGREALAVLRSEDAAVDVIVSDIGMPEMDGYQFIRSVRQDLKLSAQRLPAIAVSAFARDEDRARSLRLGFQAHLTKPYQASHLVASVQRLAAARRD